MTQCKVQFTGSRVTRDTLEGNSKLVSTAIRHIGTRVAIPTLEVHIQSFFDYMNMDPLISRTRTFLAFFKFSLFLNMCAC